MQKGFTMIELTITIAILSITAAVGIPSMSQFNQKQHLTADIITVKGMINFARNEAIKNNKNIKLCGLASEKECQKDWSTLVIFSGENSETLKTAELNGNYNSVKWSAFQRKSELSFNSTGYTNHLNGSLYLCHKTYPELNRAIRVSKSGRTQVTSDQAILSQKCN